MRGLEKNRMGRGHTTDGHRDSMIESAQWADSMKIILTLAKISRLHPVAAATLVD